MEVPVVRVASISAASRESIAADGQALVFTAGAGAVRVEISPSGTLQNPLFFHLPRKRSYTQKFPWERPQGPVVIGETVNEDTKVKAKDKVNTASCVVASSTAVAVGETGYLPRVIVYSKSAQPLAVIQEHQFGVQHLQFSPSGRYLATLGTPNDGYLYIWEIDMDTVANQTGSGVSLHSSNRCISQVNDIQWISDTQLVTVGVRHIRVWTVETGAANNGVLAGRNVVLGPQADSTFNCAVKVNGEQTGLTGAPGSPGGVSPFLVATKTAISKVGPGLSLALQLDMNINSMTMRGSDLIVAGDSVRKYDSNTLEELSCDIPVTGVKSIANGENMIFLTDKGLAQTDGSYLKEDLDETVNGIRSFGTRVASWGGNSLFVWEGEERTQEEFDFEISTVSLGLHKVVGGVEGQLSIDGEIMNAHAGPVTDTDSTDDIVISAGRDRHLQIWRMLGDKWDLQTIPLLGPLNKARIVNDETIVTVVGNKTVQIHKLVDSDFVTERTLPMKTLLLDLDVNENTIFLSTSERQLITFDASGTQLSSYKTLDIQNEPIGLSHIRATTVNGSQYVIAAASDKSVCVYSHPQGQLLAAEWAHSTPIKGIAVCGNRIISYGDLIVERQLIKEPERPASPMRSLSPVRSIRPSSPMRRPPSPFRNSAPKSPTPTRQPRPPNRPSSPVRAPSPRRMSAQPAPAPSLRLSASRLVTPPVATPTPTTMASATEHLEQALNAYIMSDESAPYLQPLLAKALAKSGTKEEAFESLADSVTGEIVKYLRTKLDTR